MSITFAQIEDAVAELLKSKGVQVAQIDLDTAPLGIANAAIRARITNCRYTVLTANRRRAVPILSIYVFVKNVKNEMSRRHAANVLVDAIISVIEGQTLGLEINPLNVLSSKPDTPSEWIGTGLEVYKIDFDTWYALPRPTQDSGSMLSIALDYFMKPGDEMPDAQDVVDVS
jgi:hypothetical protein